jgi:glutaconate CoA-transferase, subunit A
LAARHSNQAADLAALIPDGALLALPPDYSMPAMEVVRALIRKKSRNLKLLGVPVLGMCADLLIGAGCVAEVESSAVSLGEAGLAPRFTEAVEKGEIVVRDGTCPAVHTALQASEKGVPFMPLRGVLGSDLVKQRGDWQVAQNPFSTKEDPILFVAAISPDIALFHARWADEAGNVWVGRRRELATIAHAAKQTFVTYEELKPGDMLEDELLAPGVISATYVSATAPAKRGAWPLAIAGVYELDDAHLMNYAKAARTREGFRRYLDEFVCTPEKSSSPASSPA